MAGYMDNTVKKLQMIWNELRDEVYEYCTKPEGKNLEALNLAAATYVLRGVHDKLFIFVSSQHSSTDRAVAGLMAALSPVVTQARAPPSPPVLTVRPRLRNLVGDPRCWVWLVHRCRLA